MDKRQGFPPVYDFQLKSYEEDIPFWLGITNQNPDMNLELGCGTGRVSMKLASFGVKMIGIDNDIWMLRYLKDKIDRAGVQNLKVIQADMVHFNFRIKFGSIFIPCNTFSTLTSQQRIQTIKCAFYHLNEGGIFAASLPNPLFLKDLPKSSNIQLEESFFHPEDQNPVEISSGWSRDLSRFTIHWIYDHLLSDGRVNRHKVTIHHSLDVYEVHQHELTTVGFQSVNCYGGFDRSAYSREAEHLVLVAQK